MRMQSDNPYQSPSQNSKATSAHGWRGHAVGIIAAALLIVGIALFVANSAYGLMSFCIRVGLVLGALWLALPQLMGVVKRFPPWMIGTSLVAIAIVIVQPRMLIYLIPVAGLLLAFKVFSWFTHPSPPPSRPSVRPDSQSTRHNTADKGE